MKLTLIVEMEEYADGSIEITSELNPNWNSMDAPLSENLGELCRCVPLGIRAGIEAFHERCKGKLIIKEKGRG